MAGKLRYNPETGAYELTEQQPQVAAPVVTKPQTSEGENGFLTAEQMQAKREQAKKEKTTQPQPSGDLINVDALKKANEANIKAQQRAAEIEQNARQSAIDAFAGQVQTWQEEYDAERQAALDAEKRAKTNTLITSIADGLTALSNVYFATQGAPSQKLYSGTQKYMDIYTRARDKREQLQREINRKLESGNLNLAQMRADKIAAQAKSDAAIAKAQADADAAVVSAEAKNKQYNEEIKFRDTKYQDAKEQQEKENERADKQLKINQQNANTATTNSLKNPRGGSKEEKFYIIGGEVYSEEAAAAAAPTFYAQRRREIVNEINKIHRMRKRDKKKNADKLAALVEARDNLDTQWASSLNSQSGKANFLQNHYGTEAAESDDDFLANRKVKSDKKEMDDKELEGYKVTE